MSLTVPLTVLQHSQIEDLRAHAEERSRYTTDYKIPTRMLTDEVYADLLQAAIEAKDNPFKRVIDAIIAARGGKYDKPVPRLSALPAMLGAYLSSHFIDGWLYRVDGERVEAFLVTSIRYTDGSTRNDDKPSVALSLKQTGVFGEKGDRGDNGLVGSSLHWWANEVAKKSVADILNARGYLVETPDLRAAYDAQTAHHRQVLDHGYTEQFRFTGKPLVASRKEKMDRWDDKASDAWRDNRKVINVSNPKTFRFSSEAMSTAFGDVPGQVVDDDIDLDAPQYKSKDDGEGVPLEVPMAHKIQVFDLGVQDFLLVHSLDLERYEYDPTLASKLVLPKSQRHLLDILTTDIETFTGDIVEGKSAGNVVMCKGLPGVGKTLTAEVYSEIMKRPLYSIHSGSLGVTADSVRANLEVVFDRAKRWNAVLLLDEADVFVLTRGTNITQNAIVAEFLRTMEYFDGLMFMTTNMAANIDEAVLSRCAAIIAYEVPNHADMTRIWHVLAAQQNTVLSEQLVGDLVAGFGSHPRPNSIVPRDIKMLLRLALRFAASEDKPLSVELFQTVSMFRGVVWDDEAYDTHLGRTGRVDEMSSM